MTKIFSSRTIYTIFFPRYNENIIQWGKFVQIFSKLRQKYFFLCEMTTIFFQNITQNTPGENLFWFFPVVHLFASCH